MSRFLTDPNTDTITPSKEEISLSHDYLKSTILKAIKITIDKQVPDPKDEATKRNRSNLLGYLQEYIVRFTFHSLGNPDSINAISKHIFRSSETIDTIFTLRCVFFSLLDIPLSKYEYFLDKIVNDIYIPYDQSKERSIIPVEIGKRMSPVNKETLKEVLRENDFLIPLIVMNMHLSLLDITE